MRGRTPSLRPHAGGLYTTNWGGRDYYFSRDKAESERAFLDPAGTHPGALANWQAWRARSTRRPAAGRQRLRIAELARRFLDAYDQDGRPDTESYYAKSLRRFIHAFGDRFTDTVDEQHLDAFRAQLHKRTPKLAPKTIAHELNAVKTLWRYGARLKLCPALELSAIRIPRIEQSWPEDIPPEQVGHMLAKARASADGAQLEVWLALCYLCFLRPSECVRLCSREGRFEPIRADHRGPAIPKALFVLKKSKMQHRTRVPRHIVVTDQAMVWLNSARPAWPTLDAFSKAVRSACGPGGPHILRDSAASHLHSRGAARGEVDLLLGHVPGRVSLSYDQIDWRSLRERAGLLTLPSAPGLPGRS